MTSIYKAGRYRRLAWFLIGLAMLQILLLVGEPKVKAAVDSSNLSFASGAFRARWKRVDLPVAAKATNRTFLWGPGGGWAFLDEPYQESLDGKRLVQYFDKARMEITFPNINKLDPYYVTNGLLVKEMVSGKLQEGNDKFSEVGPAQVPVAGDPNNPAPTYASFGTVATIAGHNMDSARIGQLANLTLNREGQVGQNESLGQRYNVKYAYFNPQLGHNVPDVFWRFMTQSGLIYQNDQFVTGTLIDWVKVMGYPLTEAYWVKAVVAGKTVDVLVQLYERMVLTYTPANAPAYRVELGNVGQHYYSWRYPGRIHSAPWARLSITNKSSCNLIKVVLSGQDYLTLDAPSQITRTYRLGPGTYDYTASGCDAGTKTGSFTVRENQDFDLSFAISKQIV